MNIINPFYCKCGNYKCKAKKNIREYSFLKFHKTIPASVIIDIFYYFIIVKNNSKQIEASLLKKYNHKLNYHTILSILHNIRQVLANYMKHKYRTTQIGGDPDTNKIVSIDESMILHDENNNQVWLVGAIETKSKKLRLDIINERNEENLKTFIINHIVPGTHIVTDGWPSYDFLDGYDSVWTHEIHLHAQGDWGYGEHSTSKIEVTWSRIKNQITSIYNIIPKTNYIYYIREAEFRFNICKRNNSEKLDLFKNILKSVYDLNGFDFYDESKLIDFKNYDYLIIKNLKIIIKFFNIDINYFFLIFKI